MSAYFTSSFFTLWNNEGLNDLLHGEAPADTMQLCDSNSWLIRRIHHSGRRPLPTFSNRNRDRDYRLFNWPRSMQHVINPPRKRIFPGHWRKPEHLNLAKSLLSVQKPRDYALQGESPLLTVPMVGFGHQQSEIRANSSISPQSLARYHESPPFSARRVGSRAVLVRSRLRHPARRFSSSRQRKSDKGSSAPPPSLQKFTESSSPRPLPVFDNKQDAKSLKVESTKDSLTHNEQGAEFPKVESPKDSLTHNEQGADFPKVESPKDSLTHNEQGADFSKVESPKDSLTHNEQDAEFPKVESPKDSLTHNEQGADFPKVESPKVSLTHNEQGAEFPKVESPKDSLIYCHRPPGCQYFVRMKIRPEYSKCPPWWDEFDCDEIWNTHRKPPVPSPNLKGQSGESSSPEQTSPNLKVQSGESSSPEQLDEFEEILKPPSPPASSPNLKGQHGASSSSTQLDKSDEIIKHPSPPVPSPNMEGQHGASSYSAWWDELDFNQEAPIPAVSSPQPHSSSLIPPETTSSLPLQEYVCTTNTLFSFPRNTNPPIDRPFHSPMGWLWSARSPQYSPPQLEPDLEEPLDLAPLAPSAVVPDLAPVLNRAEVTPTSPFLITSVTRPVHGVNEEARQALPEPDQMVPGDEASTERNADVSVDQDAYEDADSLVQTSPSEFLRDTQFIVPPLTPPPTPSTSFPPTPSPSPPHH